MKIEKLWIVGALLATVMMSGCGSSSSVDKEVEEDNDFKGKTLIFFDNESSEQFSYDGTLKKVTDMNVEGQIQNMRGKNGKLIFWEGEEQRAVMLQESFDIKNGDVTAEDIHYIADLHDEGLEIDNPLEFDAIESLNSHLKEQQEERSEISEALTKVTNGSESLCNFFILGHHHEGEEAEEGEEALSAHIVVTRSAKVYLLKDREDGLASTQVPFALDGVTNCTKETSNIVEYDEDGVLIFMAQSQKIYLVDAHDADFHVHSTTDVKDLLSNGMTPTQVTALGEAEGHEHNHDE